MGEELKIRGAIADMWISDWNRDLSSSVDSDFSAEREAISNASHLPQWNLKMVNLLLLMERRWLQMVLWKCVCTEKNKRAVPRRAVNADAPETLISERPLKKRFEKFGNVCVCFLSK